MSEQSFNAAFKEAMAAKKEGKGGDTFKWNGKTYKAEYAAPKPKAESKPAAKAAPAKDDTGIKYDYDTPRPKVTRTGAGLRSTPDDTDMAAGSKYTPPPKKTYPRPTASAKDDTDIRSGGYSYDKPSPPKPRVAAKAPDTDINYSFANGGKVLKSHEMPSVRDMKSKMKGC